MDNKKVINNIQKSNLSAEDKELLIKLLKQEKFKEYASYLLQLLKIAPDLLKIFGIID